MAAGFATFLLPNQYANMRGGPPKKSPKKSFVSLLTRKKTMQWNIHLTFSLNCESLRHFDYIAKGWGENYNSFTGVLVMHFRELDTSLAFFISLFLAHIHSHLSWSSLRHKVRYNTKKRGVSDLCRVCDAFIYLRRGFNWGVEVWWALFWFKRWRCSRCLRFLSVLPVKWKHREMEIHSRSPCFAFLIVFAWA